MAKQYRWDSVWTRLLRSKRINMELLPEHIASCFTSEGAVPCNVVRHGDPYARAFLLIHHNHIRGDHPTRMELYWGSPEFVVRHTTSVLVEESSISSYRPNVGTEELLIPEMYLIDLQGALRYDGEQGVDLRPTKVRLWFKVVNAPERLIPLSLLLRAGRQDDISRTLYSFACECSRGEPDATVIRDLAALSISSCWSVTGAAVPRVEALVDKCLRRCGDAQEV